MYKVTAWKAVPLRKNSRPQASRAVVLGAARLTKLGELMDDVVAR
jgi:hypothetical protein